MAAPEVSEAEKFAQLRKELQAGLDDLATGRSGPGEDVFAELRSRFALKWRPGESRDPPAKRTNG